MSTERRILLTGAANGIGRATALALARPGTRLALLDRDSEALQEVCSAVADAGGFALPIVADLSDLSAIGDTFSRTAEALGGVDVIVNNAGLMSFRPIEDETARTVVDLYTVNLLAPVLLAREAVAHFRGQGAGRIVNIGSIFGSIGFAYFATYSSSKFALRGFTEALRREVHGTGIEVSYVAPRATATRLASVFGRMAQAVGMHLDPVERVADRIVAAIDGPAGDTFLGFPESLFVRINAVLPRLVDRATRKQNRTARPFAEEAAAAQRTPEPLWSPPAPPAPDTSTRTHTPPLTEQAPCRP